MTETNHDRNSSSQEYRPPGDATAPADHGSYQRLRAPAPPLEDCLDAFWSPAVPLDELPDGGTPPHEPYEVLKRLGPSPFEGSSFPLIGFLASTYERVSRLARERSVS